MCKFFPKLYNILWCIYATALISRLYREYKLWECQLSVLIGEFRETIHFLRISGTKNLLASIQRIAIKISSITNLALTYKSNLFMCPMNNKRPSVDPCGSSTSIFLHLEFT